MDPQGWLSLWACAVHRAIQITDVHLVRASKADMRAGLLGWVSVVVNGTVSLDGLTLRRSEAGRPFIAYPARTDRRRGRHPYIRPLGDHARREIESQVLDALGYRREVAP